MLHVPRTKHRPYFPCCDDDESDVKHWGKKLAASRSQDKGGNLESAGHAAIVVNGSRHTPHVRLDRESNHPSGSLGSTRKAMKHRPTRRYLEKRLRIPMQWFTSRSRRCRRSSGTNFPISAATMLPWRTFWGSWDRWEGAKRARVRVFYCILTSSVLKGLEDNLRDEKPNKPFIFLQKVRC